MINEGVDLFAVWKILGRTDHQSMMRYSHFANNTLMKAGEAGAAKLTGLTSPSIDYHSPQSEPLCEDSAGLFSRYFSGVAAISVNFGTNTKNVSSA
jgi:hypothetical protein